MSRRATNWIRSTDSALAEMRANSVSGLFSVDHDLQIAIKHENIALRLKKFAPYLRIYSALPPYFALFHPVFSLLSGSSTL